MQSIPNMATTTTSIPSSELSWLVSETQDYALLHGLSMRPSSISLSKMTTAPITLLPTSFPRDSFEVTQQLQCTLNKLMMDVAFDEQFLCQVLEQTIQVDQFTNRVFNIYKRVLKEGLAQPVSLGLFRSDYFHCTEARAPKQVEFNTIASSLGCLTTNLVHLHRHVLGLIGRHEDAAKVLESHTLSGFASALRSAWQVYASPNSCVLFLVEEYTSNICDQRLLEYELVRQQPKLKVLRRTLTQVANHGHLDAESKALVLEDLEVAVVYMRSGYDPAQYNGEEDWDARLMIERSKAIKCPSVHLHLAGTKKVQQELSKGSVLKRFIKDEQLRKRVQALFTGLYSLDHNEEGDQSFDLALREPGRFVLKPQREGGGNNVYGKDIEAFLRPLKDSKERSAFILMDLIKPSTSHNYLIRGDHEVEQTEVVSELGIFGAIIASKESVVLNTQCGQMLRTKSSEVNEGGVAAGSGFLDTLMLVDDVDQ